MDTKQMSKLVEELLVAFKASQDYLGSFEEALAAVTAFVAKVIVDNGVHPDEFLPGLLMGIDALGRRAEAQAQAIRPTVPSGKIMN